MTKRQRPVDSLLDAAREVNGWLERLGRNCCAGRSYRRIDDARERADAGREGRATGGVPADEPAPASGSRSV